VANNTIKWAVIKGENLISELNQGATSWQNILIAGADINEKNLFSELLLPFVRQKNRT
jgi:hypothetical protein